jgi:DNA helicase II / ATP-dependent DNA helicase PcrA
VIALEQNYRSTQRILAVANAVIAGNKHRHPKRLRTTNDEGPPIERRDYDDEIAEAEAVASDIATRRFTGRVQWRDVAILYRTNPQAKPLEEALRAKSIPYRVVGGTSFFDRKEVADAMAYLRAVANPADDVAVRRIINYPARGIGRTTVLRIAEEAQRTNLSFFAAAGAYVSSAGPQAAALRGFIELIEHARAELEVAERAAARMPGEGQTALARFAAELLRRLRLEEDVRADPRNARSADARVDNLRDIAGTIERYERRVWADVPGPAEEADWSPPGIEDALARLALAQRDDEEEDRAGDCVTLMTLHSAKGLEFTDVHLVGLEEGILPHARSLPEGEENFVADPIAEERRLLYVGITRAKRRLVLSSCRNRRRNRQQAPTLPSRFLDEIPEGLVDVHTDQAVVLSAEESADLRDNFFARMRTMLQPEA